MTTWTFSEFKGTFPALTGVAALAFFVQNCVLSITRAQKCPENNVSSPSQWGDMIWEARTN